MLASETIRLIQSEMQPGVGCTEPAAIGLAVSNTCLLLHGEPRRITLRISSNIFKNAYSVKIPNAGKHGVELAAALGALLAKEGNTMEIFAGVTRELTGKAEELVGRGLIRLEVQVDSRFYIHVRAESSGETVETLTLNRHDNLVFAERNGIVLLDHRTKNRAGLEENSPITSCTILELVQLCQSVPLEDIAFLEQGIAMNRAVAQSGLSGDYGLRIGRKLFQMTEQGEISGDMATFVKMNVAAACDCRMGGAPYPAMTVLGSGNQGFGAILISASAAEFLRAGRERLLRSVMMSVLITIYIKYHVGRLSPICGASLCAAAGAASIAWLLGGDERQIEGAIQNVFGNLSGMLCDGAKEGCAFKLETCAGEAVLSAKLAMAGIVVQATDGIVSETVEDTIRNIASLSQKGMERIDETIISIMQQKTGISQ